LKSSILQNIKAFSKFTGQELETQRQDKFIAMGQFKG
jgi:acetyl-CoA carboxylase carboxyl transferase subunit alpha